MRFTTVNATTYYLFLERKGVLQVLNMKNLFLKLWKQIRAWHSTLFDIE